jgi:fibrillarin-like pre-rRNA processing protein
LKPVKVVPHDCHLGVYWFTQKEGSSRLATQNLASGRTVYRETLVKVGAIEYRIWDPFRSKLAAAIYRGLKTMVVKPSDKVLYLGASTGTTASHISDIVGSSGVVYCVEFAERVMRELVSNVASYRPNIIPLLADVRYPETYRAIVEKVDLIYCDVAQPEQAKILADNADLFLKKGGKGLLAIKARSIDVTENPSTIFKRETQILIERNLMKTEALKLEPYDRDHSLVVTEYHPQT